MPYSDDIHEGVFPQLKLQTPLVPHPSHVGHVHAVGSDAVTLKPGDLVYFHPFVPARDDADVKIIQGHMGGENPKAKKLAQGEWRDGSLQQYQRVPLQNVFVLDENRLCKELGYTYADLQELPYYTMAVGALCEAACLQVGETVIIGPATGTFGGITCEVALTLGANVIAIGRNSERLKILQQQLGSNERFHWVTMTGEVDRDAAALRAATGAEVFDDWANGAMKNSPFFEAAFRALKPRGRIILSGSLPGALEVPYIAVMHQNISITGKFGIERGGVEMTIRLIVNGLIKLGERGGATHSVYSIDKHEAAFAEAKNGGFKRYVDIMPNPW